MCPREIVFKTILNNYKWLIKVLWFPSQVNLCSIVFLDRIVIIYFHFIGELKEKMNRNKQGCFIFGFFYLWIHRLQHPSHPNHFNPIITRALFERTFFPISRLAYAMNINLARRKYSIRVLVKPYSKKNWLLRQLR